MALDIISTINLDLKRPNTETVYAVQYDTAGRIKAQLTNDGEAWHVPSSAGGMVSFRKSDNIGGFYDTTELGEVAVSVDENDDSIIYIALDAQTTITATPLDHPVQMQINFYNSQGKRLSTFAFYLRVQASVLFDGDQDERPVASEWTFRILTGALGQTIKNQEEAIKWMEDNIRTQAGYVVDDTLKVEGAAGDAKKIGELFEEIVKVSDSMPGYFPTTDTARVGNTKYYTRSGTAPNYVYTEYTGATFATGVTYYEYSPWNRIWIDPDDNDVAIPTMDDHNELKSAISETNHAINIITDGDYLPYTPVTMDGWYYVNNVGRIDVHATKVARTYLIDVSDQPEYITLKISSEANRARFLYMETDINNVSSGTTGTYVDGGSEREFTLTKSDYAGYKTIAVNTDYNKNEGAELGTIAVVKVSRNMVEQISQMSEKIERISEGGTASYSPVQMDGWYYVESLGNDAGRINIHQKAGARTYLIDVSDQPESVQIKISSVANRARFLYTEMRINYVKTSTPGDYIDGGSEREFALTKSDYAGYNTIAINTDYNRGSGTTYATIEVTKTTRETATDFVARKAIEEIGTIGTKGFSIIGRKASITNNSLVICSNIDNKKNAFYELWGNVDSGFTSVKMGHGYNVSYSGYVYVDGTNIKWYKSSGTLEKSEPHGLTISGFIYIKIEQDSNAKASVKLVTLGGEYSLSNCTFHGSRGDVFCTVTGTMTNVVLSAGFRDLLEDVWFFGDSYVSMADNARWPYYAVQAGHEKFYINGFGGANSSHAILSFREALTIGTPRIVVWGIGMNNSDTSSGINSSYMSVLEEVMATCEEKGIELILCTIPNTPSRLHTYKNAYIKTMHETNGYRYVDFAKAVGAESAGSTWYSGMLEDSNGESEEQLTERVHPTILGAKTLYNRLILDVPEMNY